MTDKEATSRRPRHPMQPIVLDDHGVQRFKTNRIVRFLLDTSKYDLNQLSLMPFSKDDWTQFHQLTGYSVCGFCDLPNVSEKAKDRAWEKAERLREGK